jgi:hypothetical protein
MGMSWSKVLQISAIEVVVLITFVMVVFAGGIERVLLVFGIAFIGGLYLFKVRGRPGAMMLLVVSLVFVLANIPFIVPSLLALNSPVEFILNLLFLMGGFGTIVASVNLVRGNEGVAGEGPKRWLRGSATVVVLLAMISIFVKITEEQATQQPGDLALIAQYTEFSTQFLPINSGTFIYLENKDLFSHTFTVEELNIDIDLPGFSSRRIQIRAQPGAYEFRCTIPGHDTMKGDLSVLETGAG